jgi:geranylgeranyl pyrophosphate synthase
MPQIGEFTRSKSGFAGHIRTLTLDLDVTLVPIDPGEAENAPDHRLFHGDGDLARALSILARHDALGQARAEALRWTTQAREALSVLPEHPLRGMLADLADYVVARVV